MGELLRFPIERTLTDPQQINHHQVLSEGSQVLVCGCGSPLFFLLQQGPICRCCGKLLDAWGEDVFCLPGQDQEDPQ